MSSIFRTFLKYGVIPIILAVLLFAVLKYTILSNNKDSSSSSNSTMSDDERSLYTLPNDQPVVVLECKSAFGNLSQNEKLYAHYLSSASWSGSFIAAIQLSPESPLILAMLHNIFLHDQDISKLKERSIAAGVTEYNFTAFLVYSAGMYDNMGNYKSFGDSKIIPQIDQKSFETIIKSSTAYKQNSEKMMKVWNQIKDIIYALDNKYKSLGLGDEGVTTYFSANCVEEDAKKVKDFILSKKMESVNTRVFKTIVNNTVVYDIRLASIENKDQSPITLPEETYKGDKFKITRGDYSPLLKHVAENLEKASLYAANDNEKNMLKKYISHFSSGSLDDHKDGSRYWIKDKGPVVETYIGFIETYRDPVGERAEYEGFVAIVDKIKSVKFNALVENAQTFLKMLPWGKNFEKDTFLKPDFTALDVVAFAGSGVPLGINIPNYDYIRQNEGFKNVHLTNAVSDPISKDNYPFLLEKDIEMLHKYKLQSSDVQVGLHELLGHGSGKLLTKSRNGSFNFDQEHLINPLTGKKIDKYYNEGETYDSKFGALGSSYEECRAESVGLYLSLEKEVIKIFGHEGAEAEDIIYTNWLSMFTAGMKSLETYQPENKKWQQAHSRARFAILQVCLEAGEDLVKVNETEKGEKLQLVVNREKINTIGKTAIGEFLKKLQIYKSTGDIEAATQLYEKYSAVSDDGKYPWATWRNIVMKHRKPRRFFVQPNTFPTDDGKDVTLKNYDPSVEGVIQSWIERYPDPAIVDTLIELYKKDAHYFPLGKSEL